MSLICWAVSPAILQKGTITRRSWPSSVGWRIQRLRAEAPGTPLQQQCGTSDALVHYSGSALGETNVEHGSESADMNGKHFSAGVTVQSQVTGSWTPGLSEDVLRYSLELPGPIGRLGGRHSLLCVTVAAASAEGPQ